MLHSVTVLLWDIHSIYAFIVRQCFSLIHHKLDYIVRHLCAFSYTWSQMHLPQPWYSPPICRSLPAFEGCPEDKAPAWDSVSKSAPHASQAGRHEGLTDGLPSAPTALATFQARAQLPGFCFNASMVSAPTSATPIATFATVRRPPITRLQIGTSAVIRHLCLIFIHIISLHRLIDSSWPLPVQRYWLQSWCMMYFWL